MRTAQYNHSGHPRTSRARNELLPSIAAVDEINELIPHGTIGGRQFIGVNRVVLQDGQNRRGGEGSPLVAFMSNCVHDINLSAGHELCPQVGYGPHSLEGQAT